MSQPHNRLALFEFKSLLNFIHFISDNQQLVPQKFEHFQKLLKNPVLTGEEQRKKLEFLNKLLKSPIRSDCANGANKTLNITMSVVKKKSLSFEIETEFGLKIASRQIETISYEWIRFYGLLKML